MGKLTILMYVIEFILILLMGINVLFLDNMMLLVFQGFIYIGTVLTEKKLID